MAEETLMRLTDDVDTVDFSPAPGYDIPERRPRSVHEARDGTVYIYEWGNKELYEVPITLMPTADRAEIEIWWQSRTLVKFYPDYVTSPGTYVSVRIMNEDNPLQMAYPFFDENYSGTLILREAS